MYQFNNNLTNFYGTRQKMQGNCDYFIIFLNKRMNYFNKQTVC